MVLKWPLMALNGQTWPKTKINFQSGHPKRPQKLQTAPQTAPSSAHAATPPVHLTVTPQFTVGGSTLCHMCLHLFESGKNYHKSETPPLITSYPPAKPTPTWWSIRDSGCGEHCGQPTVALWHCGATVVFMHGICRVYVLHIYHVLDTFLFWPNMQFALRQQGFADVFCS